MREEERDKVKCIYKSLCPSAGYYTIAAVIKVVRGRAIDALLNEWTLIVSIINEEETLARRITTNVYTYIFLIDVLVIYDTILYRFSLLV